MEENNVTPEVTESYKLTEEDKSAIANVIGEEVEKSQNLRILADLPSNNGVEEHEPEEGYTKEVMVSIDPASGEKTVIGVAPEIDKKDTMENIEDLIEDYDEYDPPFDIDLHDITIDDMKKALYESDTVNIGKSEVSDETILQLIQLTSVYKEKGEIKFKDCPEEVQSIIRRYVTINGIGDYSTMSNQMRNMVANSLIGEFINQMELNRFDDSFKKGIEDLYKNSKEELSPIMMEYSESREDYLKKLTEDIDDEDKKKAIEDILDAIHDAFALERLIEKGPYIKFKAFDFEKPKRVFDPLLFKYKDTTSHIYDVNMCTNILHKHLVNNHIIEDTDDKYALKVMMGFAKVCRNYHQENLAEHAFMYYFTNNIVLLDVYVSEQYNKYAPEFLKNIQAFHDSMEK